MRAFVLFPLSLFLLTVSKCVCTEECAYILLDGSCQPLGSFTINVPRMTGKNTNRGVHSGRSVSMPKCETNPFPKPKLQSVLTAFFPLEAPQKPERGNLVRAVL